MVRHGGHVRGTPTLGQVTSLLAQMRTFRIARTPRLIVLAAVVGAGAGLGAVVLIEAIQVVRTGADWVVDRPAVDDLALLLLLPLRPGHGRGSHDPTSGDG